MNNAGRRRALLGGLVGGGVAASLSMQSSTSEADPRDRIQMTPAVGWYDVKADFHASASGTIDDTNALQAAIDAGSGAQRPVLVPPGAYMISRPLTIPSNTMLIGSSPGLGFGCVIAPIGCPAFIIGGSTQSFHCSLQNLMIWPKGPAPDCILSIDNSYSITFRNIRIHDAQDRLSRAAVVLLGDSAQGGHGTCNDIIWDNLIVRNDNGQPPVALLATRGCGTHRFYAPTLENYQTLLEWQGGQIDWITPYTERAGRYGVNCNLDANEQSAYLNTFGGTVDCANSGLGCAIRATTKNFNSFGTVWAGSADHAMYVYALPARPINVLGVEPNLGATGTSRYGGVEGWRKHVRFSLEPIRHSYTLEMEIPPAGQSRSDVKLDGVTPGAFWARVTANTDVLGAQISAFVNDANSVTIVGTNPTQKRIRLKSVFTVECGIA